MKFPSVLLVALICFLIVTTAAPLNAADIVGIVRSASGDLVPDARVSLIYLRQETTTDDRGRFIFTDVDPGEHLLEVTSLVFGAAVIRIEVTEDGPPVTIELDQMVHAGSVSVTTTGRIRGLDEVVAPIGVLTDEELALRLGPTLGETLAQQPGVSATGYGRGASRPVIRGLSADRIRVLENGLDSGDVSSIGPDHATAVEPLSAERIEIVRGPATLLYGGTAVGGVVNVIDGKVPDRIPNVPVSGTVKLSAGTNADEISGAVSVDGGGGSLAWHLEAFARDADDYSSPAPRIVGGEHDHEAESGEDEHIDPEWQTGQVENSFVESRGGALGLSWVGSRGYVGLAYSLYDSDYGVPGHSHHHDEKLGPSTVAMVFDEHDTESAHAVTIDLEQRRVDVHGRFDEPFKGVDALQFRLGWRDYQHQELEGSDVGTVFNNEFLEGRVEALLAPWGGFEGVAGLHWLDRDFQAFGEEAFVQPTTTRRVAAFLHEELKPRPWGFQVGLRGESQDTDTIDPDLPSRSFSPISASAGVTYQFSESWRLNLSASHSERAPTAEELYSDGPHIATSTYELGDPELDIEQGNGLDLTIRASGEQISGSASVFYTRFSDFIFLAETGVVEDGFDVRAFTAADAEFSGMELHGDLELYHGGENHLHLEATYDRVEGELSGDNENLPRIPPQRFRLGLVFLGTAWNSRIEGQWVDEQHKVAEFELPTPGYTMLNAAVGYHFIAGGIAHHVMLRGTNLTNEDAYNHVSFLKFQAPLAGRMVTLSYRAIF